MMLNEIVAIILDVLIENKKPLSFDEILEISDCEKVEISKSLKSLLDLQIISKEKNPKNGEFSYEIIRKIRGIQLAKAAQLGIDLNLFDDYFIIEEKEKELALKLATQAESIKKLELHQRKPLLQKRTYLVHPKADDIYENLMVLLEATNMTLYEYIEGLAHQDTYLGLLIMMHQQAEKSVRDYVSNLK